MPKLEVNGHFFILYKVSLPNIVTYPHCFLTANKRPWYLPVLAGMSDSKKPRPILLNTPKCRYLPDIIGTDELATKTVTIYNWRHTNLTFSDPLPPLSCFITKKYIIHCKISRYLCWKSVNGVDLQTGFFQVFKRRNFICKKSWAFILVVLFLKIIR